jgi:hypothetical protein
MSRDKRHWTGVSNDAAVGLIFRSGALHDARQACRNRSGRPRTYAPDFCTNLGPSLCRASEVSSIFASSTHCSSANRMRQIDQSVSVRNRHILRPANGRIHRWADGRIHRWAEWRISISVGSPSRDGETSKTGLAEGSCSVGTCSVVDSFSRCEG